MKSPAVWLAVVFLMLLPLVIFGQVLQFDFVTYDDENYVSQNPHLRGGLTRKGMEWALKADLLFNSVSADYWQPVTFLSRMMDVELWGMDPKGHHLTNLVFHLANTLLLFFLFHKMTGALWRSAWAAAFFAVHPLVVEPVAWVTARKDLLSTFFGLAALFIYRDWAKRPKILAGFLVVFFFCLSLMSKPWLISFPLLLLLIDYWPLGRFRFSAKIFLEKSFLALFAAASFFITLMGTSQTVSNSLRQNFLLKVPFHYLQYLQKTIYPVHLALLYPPEPVGMGKSAAAIVFLILVTIFAFRERKRAPYLWMGWLWFLIALLPGAAASRMENRFMYVPLIGLGTALSWGVTEVFQKKNWPRVFPIAFAISSLIFYGGLARAQTGRWQNSLTLFQYDLNVTGRNVLAEANLALAFEKKGRKKEAAEHYFKALQIDPGHQMSHHGLGRLLLEEGKLDEAVAHFHTAIKADPHLAEARNNLCVAWIRQEKFKEAVSACERAIQEAGDYFEAYNNLAIAWNGLGDPEKAGYYLREALRLDPGNRSVEANLKKLM